MQISLQREKKSRYESEDFKSKNNGTRFYPKGWSWLLGNFLIDSDVEIHSDNLICSKYWLQDLKNGHQERNFEWISWWDYLYGPTKRVHGKRLIEKSL